MGVEFLEFDLGAVTLLGFQDYFQEGVLVFVPGFDALDISRPAFIVQDEGHYVVAQAFLEHDESPYPAVAVAEGCKSEELHMEIQDV